MVYAWRAPVVSISVMRRAGVEGSVGGEDPPSGPRASSAVWLRLRSGACEEVGRSTEALRCAGAVDDSATTGAAEAAPDVVVCKSFISTALLA